MARRIDYDLDYDLDTSEFERGEKLSRVDLGLDNEPEEPDLETLQELMEEGG